MWHQHTHTHAYIKNTYTHACIHTYTHACIHTYINSCMHGCMHTYIHACMYTYIYTCIHTYTYKAMMSQMTKLLQHKRTHRLTHNSHTHTHTHTHTHNTHTHTHHKTVRAIQPTYNMSVHNNFQLMLISSATQWHYRNMYHTKDCISPLTLLNPKYLSLHKITNGIYQLKTQSVATNMPHIHTHLAHAH